MKASITRNTDLKPVYGRAGGLALILLLTSCAGTPSPEQVAAGVECEYVKVTGSNMPVRECTTAAQREAIAAMRREAGEQGLRDMQKLDEFGVESVGASSLP